MDLWDRGKGLEDAFFKERDARLIAEIYKKEKIQKSKEELAQLSGIRNEKVLDKLIELNVSPAVLASLTILPLIEVAWADGTLDAQEREAILKASTESGFIKGSIDYQLLESWLKERPAQTFLEAWLYYMKGLCEVLTQTELDSLRIAIMDRARRVAEAAGGFMGIVNKVSDKEQAVLKKMENAFKR